MPPTLTVIWWRDIPAQVVAKDGRRSAKAMLHRRFQVAIDRAAARSGRKEMNAYIGEWRREGRRCGDDLDAEVRAEAARLDAEYPNQRLKRLYENGGLADGDGLAPPDADPAPFWPVTATDTVPAGPDARPGAASGEAGEPSPARTGAAAGPMVDPTMADQESQ
jgi:hypothetical protein